MKIRNLFVTVCGSVAIAACGGGGGGDGGGLAGPTSVTVPAWVTLDDANPAISSNRTDGTLTSAVNITFNTDGSITFDINNTDPNVADSLTVTNADISVSSSGPAGELFFFVANPTPVPGGGTDVDFVELVILDDPAEQDIIALARIDQQGTGLGYETAAVIGNATDTTNLPTADVRYTGFMIGSLLFGGALPLDINGDPDIQYNFVEANATVDALFGATTNVNVTFSNFTVPNSAGGNTPLTGSGLSSNAVLLPSTSQYTGSLSGDIVANGTTYGMTGTLIGGFFGANAEATAGTFDADSTGNVEFVGNFAAN